jgi:type IV pilus assembly protein PilE
MGGERGPYPHPRLTNNPVMDVTDGKRAAARPRPGWREPPQGFSLIELMLVLVVIGVLAVVTYPIFADQVRKSRRTDAMVALNKVSLAQERWRANRATYTNNLADLTGVSAPRHYTLSLSTDPASAGHTYLALATAIGAQLSDTRCAVLTLQMSGGQLSPWAGDHNGGNTTRECWKQ